MGPNPNSRPAIAYPPSPSPTLSPAAATWSSVWGCTRAQLHWALQRNSYSATLSREGGENRTAGWEGESPAHSHYNYSVKIKSIVPLVGCCREYYASPPLSQLRQLPGAAWTCAPQICAGIQLYTLNSLISLPWETGVLVSLTCVQKVQDLRFNHMYTLNSWTPCYDML